VEQGAPKAEFGVAGLNQMPKNIVLCVDDEPIVLRACSIAVALFGFRPVVAENGAAGFGSVHASEGRNLSFPVRLVMPAVNGIDMTASILQIAPQAKIFSCPGIATR
jgi:DNA-binding NtrC family response regulator